MSKKRTRRFRQEAKGRTVEILTNDNDPRTKPDWSRGCENCQARPVVPCTGLCGPCTFGEAETANGNW